MTDTTQGHQQAITGLDAVLNADQQAAPPARMVRRDRDFLIAARNTITRLARSHHG